MSVAAAVHGGILAKRRWTPSELGTISLWLDADDATTITESSGAVSEWRDKSGNARHVSQATAANQPTYVAAAQNGRAVVRFDGTNAFLTGGDILDLQTGGISILAAHTNNTSSTLNVITKTAAGVNANGEWVLFTGRSEWFMGGELYTRGLSAITGSQITGWVLDRSSESNYWRNGTVSTNFGNTTFPNTDNLNTGAPLQVGGRGSSTTLRMNGDIMEIVVAMTAIANDERQLVEGYLAWKWGMVSSLPADHPYKNIQP